MDLSKIPKQRFDYRELWKLEPDMDYDQLSRLVEQLCEEGKIIPVKNSGKTSFFPPVYMEYKKLAQKKDYSAYLSEIAALIQNFLSAGIWGSRRPLPGAGKKFSCSVNFCGGRMAGLRRCL